MNCGWCWLNYRSVCLPALLFVLRSSSSFRLKMNNRGNINETNLVNFSADISTQLDTKLSFPFDHIYASHSDSVDRRQTLQVDKDIEVSTRCAVTEDKDVLGSSCAEISELAGRLATTVTQNKRLKELLIYHLDLIQQQNELISERDKVHRALKQENDTLKSRLNRMDRRIAVNQKNCANTSSFAQAPTTPTFTTTIVKSEPRSPASQIMLNSFPDLVLSDNRTKSFINKPKPLEKEPFQLSRTTEADVTSYLPNELGGSSILNNNLNCEKYSMIESKRPFIKKEMDVESRSDALYSVTSNSGNPVIQRVQRSRRRASSGIGSLSRICNNLGAKVEYSVSNATFKYDKGYEPIFSVNKKSKMVNTYGKSRSSNLKSTTSLFTGSLSDRLKLIDTTPTGDDPYQLGEADMREQSPIPKLMLQKSNHGRMKICTDTSSEGTGAFRRYTNVTNSNVAETNTKVIKLEKYDLSTEIKSESPKTMTVETPDLNIVKMEPESEWQMYNLNKQGNETSLCDFSYGETPNNLTSHILPSLDSFEFQELFSSESPLQLEILDSEKNNITDATVKTRKRVARTTSLIGSNAVGVNINEIADIKHDVDSKRGRKRALSTIGLMKTIKCEKPLKFVGQRPQLLKSKVSRGKKSPTPGMVTTKPYHTLVGDPDVSWYLGLDPDVKLEDADQSDCNKVSTVEVPRWREKSYTSCYTLEGTENLNDSIFEKRHQKLEAEERRQLRWHMRRIREQRHVERLRQRQRDSWCEGGSSVQVHPSMYTVWPQPQRDVRFIEITDSLPVMAFGEILPALPEADFMLPWVKTSKALKRSKRCKTMH